MDRELLGNDRIALINAISQGDFAAIDQFAEKWPKLDVKLDVAGNSALHYAVARCDVQVVSYLIEVIGVDVAIQNRHGETPYDWWSELVKSSFGFKNPEQVALVIEAVKQDDTDFFIDGLGCGVSPRLRVLVEGSIGTVLHWGIHWHRPDTVKILLAKISDNSFLELLTIRDNHGKTLSLLAKEQSQQGDIKATEILKYLQAKQHAIEANQGAHAQPHPANRGMMVLIENYEKHLLILRKKLFDGIMESDYSCLRPTLPALCALAYYTCQQALQQFAHQPFLEKQALLLERLSGNALERLRKTIEITTNYLGNILQKDRVNQMVELCARFPNGQTPDGGGVGLALCDMQDEKIYLNLTPKVLIGSDISTVVMTVIHEVSHLAARTQDLAKAEDLLAVTGETVFHLNPCIQLAEQAECDSEFPVWKNKVEDIARLLEPVGDQQPRMQLGQYLATQNADTIALAAIGLSAIASGFGDFVNRSSPPIGGYKRQDLRGEWSALELDRGLFSSNRIKGMLEESNTMNWRPQTPPPNHHNRAIGLDSDEEKQSPQKLDAAYYADDTKVAKLTHIIADYSIPSELGKESSCLELSSLVLNTQTSHLVSNKAQQVTYSHQSDYSPLL